MTTFNKSVNWWSWQRKGRLQTFLNDFFHIDCLFADWLVDCNKLIDCSKFVPRLTDRIAIFEIDDCFHRKMIDFDQKLIVCDLSLLQLLLIELVHVVLVASVAKVVCLDDDVEIVLQQHCVSRSLSLWKLWNMAISFKLVRLQHPSPQLQLWTWELKTNRKIRSPRVCSRTWEL